MPPIKGRRAKPADTTTKGHRSNSLGLGEHEAAAVLDKLDSMPSGKASVKRTFARMRFRIPSLLLTMTHPGGTCTDVHVVCRNMSRGGVGVLHSAFAHTGTQCVVHMPRLDGRIDQIEGTIVRCSHVTGQIHEFGIVFATEIDPTKYIQFDSSEGFSTFERVNPESLEGTAVALLSSEIEGRMLGHFLTDSNLKLKITSDTEECAKFISDGCDILLLDLTVEGVDDLAVTARRLSAGLPVVAIATDSSATTRARVETLGASGLLTKPLTNDRLLSTLAECLLISSSIQLDHESAHPMSPELINACIEQIQQIVEQLREAAEGDDAMQCYALCQQVKATCAPMGLADVDAAADRASLEISQTMSTTESQKAIQELLRMCSRVKQPTK